VGAEQELAILCLVQEADTEIARLSQALAGLDAGDALQAEVNSTEAEVAALREQHEVTERQQLDRELELKTLEEKRGKFRDQLYSGTVRNPRQLSDLQKEVQMLSEEISKIEDQILDLMEALEKQRSELADREQRLAELRAQLQTTREDHARTGGRLRSDIADQEAKRGALSEQVSPQLMKRYEQIRSRQGDLGLVRVGGDTCPGCRIAFPSDLIKALKRGSQVLTCENCGRLLFWDAGTD
jgi:predicted  nucleic acid-binding Zn-ribbon protein